MRIQRPYMHKPQQVAASTDAARATTTAAEPVTATDTPETAMPVVENRIEAEAGVPFAAAPADAAAAVVEPRPGALRAVGSWVVEETADGVTVRRNKPGDSSRAEKSKRGVTLRLGSGQEEIVLMIARTGGIEDEQPDKDADVHVRGQGDPGASAETGGGGAAAEVVVGDSV